MKTAERNDADRNETLMCEWLAGKLAEGLGFETIEEVSLDEIPE